MRLDIRLRLRAATTGTGQSFSVREKSESPDKIYMEVSTTKLFRLTVYKTSNQTSLFSKY